MEGALDQAAFLARVDIPIAVIGPRGTGKFYVASTVHREAGGAPDQLVTIDCREFRNREQALRRLREELEAAEGKTLVFKSPHLMNATAQNRLARQLATRRLDSKPVRYLPTARFIGLFPERLEQLVRSADLAPALASVFAGYPVYVPPLRFRQRAIPRWAQKILAQESACRRPVKGFTPDAEQAMMTHDWPGNITELRQRIVAALESVEREWIAASDLGLFPGVSPARSPVGGEAYLDSLLHLPIEQEAYDPGVQQELALALGRALHQVIESGSREPLGTWLWDEVLLAAIERYGGNLPRAAGFLGTSSRNLGRWQPKIDLRAASREGSPLWREPRRLVSDWIREQPLADQSLRERSQALLYTELARYADRLPAARQAEIMGVSVPTYNKLKQRLAGEVDDSD